MDTGELQDHWASGFLVNVWGQATVKKLNTETRAYHTKSGIF